VSVLRAVCRAGLTRCGSVLYMPHIPHHNNNTYSDNNNTSLLIQAAIVATNQTTRHDPTTTTTTTATAANAKVVRWIPLSSRFVLHTTDRHYYRIPHSPHRANTPPYPTPNTITSPPPPYKESRIGLSRVGDNVCALLLVCVCGRSFVSVLSVVWCVGCVAVVWCVVAESGVMAQC